MIALRTETGGKDAYGYSVLGRETGHNEISAHPGIAVAPFLQRRKRLAPAIARDVSKVFAGHLQRLGKARTKELLQESVRGLCEAIFNFQMVGYRLYNPVDWLVCRELLNAGHKVVFPASHDSFLSLKGKGNATATANLISVDNGKYWIKCQSAYDGRIDKRKELCGRIGAMKLCYSATELKTKRFYLVIDGFFNVEDIRLFGGAGWDGVFYYDELDILEKTIREHS
jgi:hypothetical protein